MKNIKLQNIFFNKITQFNNFLINKFNQIKIFKNKFNRINHLKNKFNKISNFNKFLIFIISSLFIYLFYASTPSLYDNQKLQNQLKTHIANKYNLNILVSNKIQYKILPSPHFEVKDSIIYRDGEYSDEKKLGELKYLKIFASITNIHNQDKVKFKNIEIKEAIFFLNKNNQKFISNYLIKKNTLSKILIKKSNVFLMNKKDVISIFPIKKIDFKYNEKKFINEAIISGKAFNSDFSLDIKKYFFDKKNLQVNIKFPQINLAINSEMLPQNNNEYKLFNKINFFGSEIKSEVDVNKDSLIFKSKKSKIFNSQINFKGKVELEPFYLTSKIKLDQVNLIKILKNNNHLFMLLDNKNLLHKNFNSNISLNINKFSKDNIFDKANFLIEIQNGLIKFDNSIFISKKLGTLKILRSSIYTNDNKFFLNSEVLIDIHNQKKFYNTFQIPKSYRKNIEKIKFDFVTNITSGNTKIKSFYINDIISNNLAKKISEVIVNDNIDINRNFNNWIVLKRIINSIVLQIN